jgi:hypothetical protein
MTTACAQLGLGKRKRQQGELARLRKQVEEDPRYNTVRQNLEEFLLGLFRDALIKDSDPPEPNPEIKTKEQLMDPDRPYEFINIEKATMEDMLIKPNNKRVRKWGLHAQIEGTLKLYYPPPKNLSKATMKQLIKSHFEGKYLPTVFSTDNYSEIDEKQMQRDWGNILKPRLKMILECLDRFYSTKSQGDLASIQPYFKGPS